MTTETGQALPPGLIDVEADAAIRDRGAAMTFDVQLRARPEDCQAAFEKRWGGVADIRALKGVQVHLTEGIEDEAWRTWERLRELEMQYAAPGLEAASYGPGVATREDDIAVVYGGPAIVTADHATNPGYRKKGNNSGADQGTAALAAVMAEDGMADACIMTGLQTGNVGSTPNHPLKLFVGGDGKTPGHLSIGHNGVLSLHSKFPGQGGPLDTAESHAYIGFGRYQPRERTVAIAERLISYAADELGLRVAIGNRTYHARYQNDPAAPRGAICNKLPEVVRDGQGLPEVGRLAGASPESLTSWMMRRTHGDPLHGNKPIFQLEVSNALCVTAEGRYNRDPKAAAMNCHFGYLLVREAMRLTAQPATI